MNLWFPNDPIRMKITIALDVEATSTFAEIKAQILNAEGIVPEEKCLMCRMGDDGKQYKEVENECTLLDYNLRMESCLQMRVKKDIKRAPPEKWNTLRHD